MTTTRGAWCEDGLHVVLTEHQSEPPTPHRLHYEHHDRGALLDTHTGGRLVQQQNAGAQREHHRQLQALALALGERRGGVRPLVEQTHLGESVLNCTPLRVATRARAVF